MDRLRRFFREAGGWKLRADVELGGLYCEQEDRLWQDCRIDMITSNSRGILLRRATYRLDSELIGYGGGSHRI